VCQIQVAGDVGIVVTVQIWIRHYLRNSRDRKIARTPSSTSPPRLVIDDPIPDSSVSRTQILTRKVITLLGKVVVLGVRPVCEYCLGHLNGTKVDFFSPADGASLLADAQGPSPVLGLGRSVNPSATF